MTVLDFGKKSIHTTVKKAPLSNNIDDCSGPSDIIEMWRGHFQDIFNNVSNVTDKQFVEDRINCISDHDITTPGDIEEALNDLKSGKCAGLDNIQAEHLKNAGVSFCHGSVNCHGSDGKIYHFCESSKSVEIFTGWMGGWGLVVTKAHHQLRCQCH